MNKKVIPDYILAMIYILGASVLEALLLVIVSLESDYLKILAMTPLLLWILSTFLISVVIKIILNKYSLINKKRMLILSLIFFLVFYVIANLFLKALLCGGNGGYLYLFAFAFGCLRRLVGVGPEGFYLCENISASYHVFNLFISLIFIYLFGNIFLNHSVKKQVIKN